MIPMDTQAILKTLIWGRNYESENIRLEAHVPNVDCKEQLMILRYIALGFLLSGGIMQQALAQKKITLIAAPEVIAIPIAENDEPFIDLQNQMVLAYGPSPEIPDNTDYTKMRKSVYDKLVLAQSLLPKGIKLCVYEGYRSLKLQRTLFENKLTEVKASHPKWTEKQVFDETIKLVSPLTNMDGSRNVPTHSTGAAVDVYLIDDSGKPLDMGLLVKDWIQDKDGALSQTDSQRISPEAQQNRNIMNQALSAVGLVNYPTEYWHWSYGDRYWAHQTGNPRATYGYME
jgi:zinc D-Ala-D-Ala dipeptidase